MTCLACGNDISGDSSYCSKCGTPVDSGNQTAKTEEITQNIESLSSLSFVKGEKFTDRYRILDVVGHGGMGKVYKAEDLELGSIVALKMIHPELLKDDRMIKRFKKEILLAREITHENVVRIHDFGKKDQVQFISMEYIEGKNLKEWLEDEEKLDIKQTVEFFKQICRGLQYAHKQGIVHRDLKPQNIMVDKKGKAIITDFGLAKTIETKDLSQTGTAIGTPEYISPEQALGDEVNQRADIYALGLIIYELITGVPPFHSSTAYGYLHKHAYTKPKPPSQLNHQISPFLESIVLKCLKKSPNDRYQGTEDILLDLDDERILTPTGMVSYWARRLLKYAGIAAAMGVIVLISHFILLQTSKNTPPAADQNTKISVAVMYFENMTGDAKMNHWRKAFSELLISDLSQSKYLNVVSGDRLYEILSDMNQVESPSYSAKTLRDVAEKTNATHIVRGTFARDQKELRLNIDLKDVRTGLSLGTEQVACKGGESYFDMIDRVTDRIKPRLQLTDTQIAGDINKSVGQITTTSPEALKLYIEGREFYLKEKYQKAIDSLEQAVKIDPQFAMAYKNLSVYYGYIGNIKKSQYNLKTSLKLVERVSTRERLFIEGYAEIILADSYQNAIIKFKELLEIYPQDIEARIQLGSIYRNLEEWDLMKEQFELQVQLDKKAPWAHYNLVLVLCSTGKYDEALKLLVENPEAFPSEIIYHNFLATLYFCQNKKEQAFGEIDKSLEIDSQNYRTLESKAQFHLIYEEYKKVDEINKFLIGHINENAKTNGLYLKNQLYLQQGKFKKFFSEINNDIKFLRNSDQKIDELSFNLLGAYISISNNLKAKSIEFLNTASKIASEINRIKHKIKILHYQGLAFIKFNQIKEAEGVIRQLEALMKNHKYRKIKRIYHQLNAELFLKRKNYSSGIKSINKAIDLLNSQFRDVHDKHAYYLNTLAKIYYQQRDYNKASKVYKQILKLSTGRIHYGDIYVKSFYWLGKISIIEGRTDEAIKYFENFLSLWNDADTDILELSEVKKKITELKKS